MNVSTLRTSLLTFAAAAIFVCPGHSRAANFNYHVDVNVGALIASPTNAPYYLDFQLNGDGLPATATNTVTLSNFTFTLGSASGSATTYEGASGDLAAGVILTLSGSNNLNELYQGFTGTTTDIQFDVSSTQNGSGITPDSFLVMILNGSLNPIATNAPDAVSLLSESINGPVTLAGVQSYRSTSPAGVIANAVPEPSTWAMAALGMVALAGVVLRRRSARA